MPPAVSSRAPNVATLQGRERELRSWNCRRLELNTPEAMEAGGPFPSVAKVYWHTVTEDRRCKIATVPALSSGILAYSCSVQPFFALPDHPASQLAVVK